nr:MAG TPA: hypothetical protein [Caudoviricetes sp.]
MTFGYNAGILSIYNRSNLSKTKLKAVFGPKIGCRMPPFSSLWIEN